MAISSADLIALETRLNAKVFQFAASFRLSVHFSIERVNDPRNVPPIELSELERIFDSLIDQHMQSILALQDLDTFNVRCLTSHINIPCQLRKIIGENLANITHKTIAITVIRKQFFVARDPLEFQV